MPSPVLKVPATQAVISVASVAASSARHPTEGQERPRSPGRIRWRYDGAICYAISDYGTS